MKKTALSRRAAKTSALKQSFGRPFVERLEERCQPSLFGAPIVISSTGSSFTSGHFTADGKLDLAVVALTTAPANRGSTLTILQGQSDGTFRTLSTMSTDGIEPLAAADVNGDGKEDLIGGSASGFSVYLGNGDGTFQAPITTITKNGSTHPIVLGDFTGNGKLDLVTAGALYLGNGDGTFQPNPLPVSMVGNVSAITTGDFNHDGKLDLAYTEFLGKMGVLLGNGDGTFTQKALYDAVEPSDVQTGDFRNDGKLDLAVVSNFGFGVSFFQGNGDGTFEPASFLPSPNMEQPSFDAVGDFNGDGKLDLAVTAFLPGITIPPPGVVVVFQGNGDGTFAAPLTFPAGIAPAQIQAVDFLGNGRADLVVANDEGIVLLPNTFVAPKQTPNQAYVERLYTDLLNRAADAGGLAFFTGLLDKGMARSQVVLTIEQSPEYRTDQVIRLYAAILGRLPDAGGLQHFVNFMLAGHSLEEVETIIYGSNEFYALAGGTANGFVSQLYSMALGRGTDSAGLADFTAFLRRGFSTFDVAFLVVHSTEWRTRLVNGFYAEFLGREADPAGLASFMAPRLSDDFILAAILGSDEFFANMQEQT